MTGRRVSLYAIAALTMVTPAFGQDSVSKTGFLPGDAVTPWQDAVHPNGSEQCNRYVVDMTTLTTSWGNTYGIAPIVKTSKTSSPFFSSLISSQGISRTQIQNTTSTGAFDLWTAPGFGVNNDGAINDPGVPTSESDNVNQFATVFAEFSTTDGGFSSNNIVSGLVQYDPSQPSRLYVERIVTAVNGCDEFSDVAQIGAGSVDAAGNAVFRADDFSLGGSAICPLLPITGNNVYMVDNAARDCDARNVISGDYPGGEFDAPATEWILRSDFVGHSTPGIATVAGTPTYIGANFDAEFVRGATFPTVADLTHHAAGVSDTRGNASHMSKNYAPLSSSNGLGAVLGKNGSPTNTLNIWGLDAAGNVSGTLGLLLPAVVTDNQTGVTSLAVHEFDHYHSQVPFRGGNGQVAMNLDHAGNLLAAAEVDQDPSSVTSNSLPTNYIAVARHNATTGAVDWTMAGYYNGAGIGKPILDGPGGVAIGQMSGLDLVTGGTTSGPSMSAPMIDSFGNVWFWAAYEDFGAADFRTGLIKANYDASTFSYELELVVTTGETFAGLNSGRDWQLRFVGLADGNSISSGTLFSQNVQETGHNGQTHFGLPAEDPKHLGGLVLGAEIVYDYEGDGDFDKSTGTGGDPTSADEDYNTLIYIAPVEDCEIDLGSQGPGGATLSICGEGLNAGQTSTFRLTNVPPSSLTFVVVSLPGFPDFNKFGGTFVSATGLLPGFPLTLATFPTGELVFPVPGDPTQFDIVIQCATQDPSQPFNFNISNAVLAKFGQ